MTPSAMPRTTDQPETQSEPLTPSLSPELIRHLFRHCKNYRDADDRRAYRQLATTLVPFFILTAMMIWMANFALWLPLILALPVGGLLVRLFAIQHDCGHGSFFSTRKANSTVGRLLSVLTLTPYDYWSRTHTIHHATAGDLGRRGIGDVDTLTVREFSELSDAARWRYRLYRHPLILHIVGPPIYFILLQRSPFGQALPPREAWRSIMGLNAALVLFYGLAIFFLGLGPVLATALPIAFVASWTGGWLFFVQHQFEHTHWEEGDDWNHQTAALEGSSYYVLPPVLDWFTAYIGLHHIHHLNSRIPNYRLRECMNDEPMLGQISRLTMRDSLRCIGMSLWDEDAGKLVKFPA